MEYKDYYRSLGVDRKASSEEIQKSYRKLARKYHPDVNKAKGAEDRFKEISEAYEVLKDNDKRQQYDALGSNWQAGQNFRPPPGGEQSAKGNPFGFGGGGFSGGSSQDFGQFSDFFDSLFGGRSSAGRKKGHAGFSEDMFSGAQQQKRDQEADIAISIGEAISGTVRNVSLDSGQGAIKTLKVKIPAATVPGSKIRLSGQAPMGGDLYLRVNVSVQGNVTISDSDLIVKTPISPWEAVLGTKIEVELPDGRITTNIKAGAQSGGRMRIRGRGLPKGKDQRGDAYLELSVVVPKDISAKERELYEKLAAESKFNPRTDR